jgi:phosphoribosylanthranilate isomerase
LLPVKICGITRLEDALACTRHGAAALGFVFAPSPRQVSVPQAAAITRQLPPFVIRVGVFVNEDPDRIREIMRDCRLDLAQLHGEETVAAAARLDGRVIKAFKAGRDHPAPPWREANIRAVLVDAYRPGVAGGTGCTFDWELFEAFRGLGHPLILAGGLDAGNIASAARQARPDAVDLSSSVEARPGIKDPLKIRQLLEQARSL